MMGAGIAYSCARAGMQVVLKDVSHGGGREGQGLHRQAQRQGHRARQAHRRRRRTSCSAGSPRPPRPGDLAGCDLVIEAVFEDPTLKAKVFAEVDAVRQRRRAAVLQHLHPADHRARRRRRPPGRLHRPALLQPGRQDAARRDHPRRGDLRRGAGQGVRRRAADPQDPDRGQRQPRLLHLARHRHADQRGPDDARRGRAPGLARAGRHAGRLPGRAAADQRRAQHGADGQDPQGHRGGRRARRRRPAATTRPARSSRR